MLAATIATAATASTASQNIGSSRAKTNSEREKVSGEYLNNSSNTTRPIANPDYEPRAPDQVPGVVAGTRKAGTARGPPQSELTCWLTVRLARGRRKAPTADGIINAFGSCRRDAYTRRGGPLNGVRHLFPREAPQWTWTKGSGWS